MKITLPKNWFLPQEVTLKFGKCFNKQGHAIVSPVPSLFTFNIKDPRIKELPGVAAQVTVKVKDTKLVSTGPLLITHWGMSGPAILKLSAWGARILFDKNYQFPFCQLAKRYDAEMPRKF